MKEYSLQQFNKLGLLEKILSVKQSKIKISTLNVTILKVSSDQLIQDFSDLFLKQLLLLDKLPINIGYNRHTIFKDNTQINFHDSNYLLSKKFRYIKQESLLDSSIFLIFINIHDSRGISNIKQLLDEIQGVHSNLQKIKLYGILICKENNFLLNLVKENQINLIKTTYNFNSYLEVDIDNICIDDILNRIMN